MIRVRSTGPTNRRLYAFLSLVLGLTLAACDSADPRSGGTYSYEAFGEDGSMIVEGMLELEFGEEAQDGSIVVSGSWDLVATEGDGETGPQTGEGDLEGTIGHDGTIWINLNPSWADNNVFLSGSFGGVLFEDFVGTWMYSTLVGPVAEGSFTAERE